MLRGSGHKLSVIVFLTFFSMEACCDKSSTLQIGSISMINTMNASEINRIKSVYAGNLRGKRQYYQWRPFMRKENKNPKEYYLTSQYRPIYLTENIFQSKNRKLPSVKNNNVGMVKSMLLRKKQNNAVQSVDANITENNLFKKYIRSIDFLERKFYMDTFAKLLANSPPERRENGISFVQSALFLHMALTALTSAVNQTIRSEIESVSCYSASEEEKTKVLKYIMSKGIPESNDDLKFRKSYRLLLASALNVTKQFQHGTAKELNLKIDYFNKTDNPASLAKILNRMVELDSGGALRDTFDEEDLSERTCSVFVSTLYMRGRWRSAPTLLDGVRPFYDNTEGYRTTRMLRINDVVKYAQLNDWDAQAVEIPYATPDLSLLLVVPRGRSLRSVSEKLGSMGVTHVTEQMITKRVRVTLPLYTLRMTLMLPNKLRDMGISSLLGDDAVPPEGSTSATQNSRHCETFHLSQAVQRIMFWAEAGRNAYKDDGIDWDERPELDLIVDRPYIFFVRWRNITLMNGHFVL